MSLCKIVKHAPNYSRTQVQIQYKRFYFPFSFIFAEMNSGWVTWKAFPKLRHSSIGRNFSSTSLVCNIHRRKKVVYPIGTCKTVIGDLVGWVCSATCFHTFCWILNELLKIAQLKDILPRVIDVLFWRAPCSCKCNINCPFRSYFQPTFLRDLTEGKFFTSIFDLPKYWLSHFWE